MDHPGAEEVNRPSQKICRPNPLPAVRVQGSWGRSGGGGLLVPWIAGEPLKGDRVPGLWSFLFVPSLCYLGGGVLR